MPIPIVNRIPLEIISSIFRLAYAQRNTAICDNEIYPGPVQTTLSLVCRKWRVVINSCHFLWEDISLRYQITPESRPYDPKTCLFSLFLSKSLEWGRPFTISLAFRVEVPITTSSGRLSAIINDRAHTIGNMLKLQAAWLKGFSLTTRPWEVHSAFLRALEGTNFPILESWKSSFDGADAEIVPDMAGPEDRIDIFRNMHFPSLQHLYLEGALCRWSHFQLNHLTSLSITQMSDPFRLHPRRLEHILQQNGGSLQTLSLQGSLYPDPQTYAQELFDDDFPKFSLPRVEELTLGFLTPQEITHFMARIAISQLRELIINNLKSSIPRARMLLALLSAIVAEFPSLAALQRVTLRRLRAGSGDVTLTPQQCKDLLQALEQEAEDDDQVDDVGENADADADEDSEAETQGQAWGWDDDIELDNEFEWDTDFDV
ncbi:uncharacterized protein EV420DRAFT_1485896 [Desarmillaria tabescens]|uniref:F-box domain-containing protein n=1 Tax=Armillaria tabescens TaxID=1929756 RepID=A0AA39MMX2_ARMTA|nr:uncharacterized protein EV420DRAFT_1485896 [Desarmillaria tabescens]KAK0440686.1 hypothetical protein EV420DRAFT_1485896 [Desarmillaria tabescens]